MIQSKPVERYSLEIVSSRGERSAWLWVALYSLFYFPLTIIRASGRPLWFDELFTLSISRLDFSRIWAILSSGSEPNPPISYFLTHVCIRTFGTNEISMRLPEIFGFWLMSVCVFFFVLRRCSFLPAMAAMLFPLCTKAYLEYAIEARAYGLVLGFAALAALYWQRATDSPTRNGRAIATIAFSLSLMAAICSHYYSVLLLIPFGIAELVRWWRMGRLNIPLSGALVASLLPLLFLAPAVKRGSTFIASTVKASPNFWAKPSATQVPMFFMEILNGVVPALLLALAVIVSFRIFWPREERASETGVRYPPMHEIAMAVALTALPVFALVIGKVVTGSFIPRYALSAVIGCSLLFGFFVYWASRGQRLPSAAICSALFLWFLANGVHKPTPVTKMAVTLSPGLDNDLPIVIADPLTFLPMLHYAPAGFAKRIHYLTDVPAAVTLPDFVPELALNQMKKWDPIPVDDYTTFLSAHHRFALYYNGSEPTLEWLPEKLSADGEQVVLKSQSGDVQIFEVTGK